MLYKFWCPFIWCFIWLMSVNSSWCIDSLIIVWWLSLSLIIFLVWNIYCLHNYDCSFNFMLLLIMLVWLLYWHLLLVCVYHWDSMGCTVNYWKLNFVFSVLEKNMVKWSLWLFFTEFTLLTFNCIIYKWKCTVKYSKLTMYFLHFIFYFLISLKPFVLIAAF